MPDRSPRLNLKDRSVRLTHEGSVALLAGCKRIPEIAGVLYKTQNRMGRLQV